MNKKDVMKWLEAEQEKYGGMFIDAEEADNDEKMYYADGKHKIVSDALGVLGEL